LWVVGLLLFNFIASIMYYFMHYDVPLSIKR
jgi:hypothetical protein